MHMNNVRQRHYTAKKHKGDPMHAPRVPGVGVCGPGGPAFVAGFHEWYQLADELAKAVRKHVLLNRGRSRPLLERSCANVAFCCISGGAGCESGN